MSGPPGRLTLRGRKTYLSVKPHEMARVYTLRLELENPDGVLRPGMFVDALVLKETRPNSVLVPLFAVIPGEEGHAVFVVVPVAAAPGSPATTATEVAQRRLVKLGVMQGAQVEIVSGLKPGERLIVMGQRSVAEGSPVAVTRTVKDLAELTR